MRLRGIDFGPVLDASGVRGFFGEGYPYHRLMRPFGLDFTGSTFVAKTTTLFARPGNMPLNRDLSPKSFMPDCIEVKFLKGVTLNAVGLSGPGATALLRTRRWQRRTKPFFLSFMSVAATATERVEELTIFVALLRSRLAEFQAPLGLQINLSCPNVGLHPEDAEREAADALSAAATLGIPLMPKFAVTMPPAVAVRISGHPACDAICVSNTVPWGSFPARIDWQGLFGSATSPLAKYGGGGLSGKPLLPLVAEWVTEARRLGLTKPINAGGGVLAAADALTLLDSGATSVFVGSMSMLRPWRVRSVICAARAHAPGR
jgi:dihydroorotate dehydrogenase